ncbi:MAG: DUF1249 domain-containing protein [Gammaproteobacteria bacterium]|nr:DUF1249 domain-containing protein [Gammaproteobacteria bacterium]MCP4091171.1 DUF1249 domain-containing protein [Gammaproteobacteria bacterium]MCP4277303.1 DUF1249 domain-containing protein [Gammaproteobacteria bacterium]MCP4831636.1 DUF1249 domain-containing protein [Gammaproteobacteria bacterium]MCP4927859.1 DUF1249 domain-containing protein [Gammaproteobacteria bacterium]
MFADSYIVPECIARPGSFGGLMTLYEANYIKLIQLMPKLSDRTGSAVSSDNAGDNDNFDCDLHLTIEHQTKFTCDLRLTYLFEDEGRLVTEPDLIARVYYDARMVEVYSWADGHRHEVLKSLSRQCRRGLDQCWVRNIMLSKWLDYLQERGYFFPLFSL